MDTPPDRQRTPDRLPVGLIALLVFAVALALFLFLLRSDRDRVPLAERVVVEEVRAFEEAVQRDLGVVEVRPAPRIRVQASRVVWHDDAGEAWLQAPRASFVVHVADALGGIVTIADGVLESPRVRLIERGPGQWNVLAAFAPLLDPDRPATDLETEIRLRNIRIRNGDVSVAWAGETYRATAVQAVLASGVLAGPGVPEPRLHFASARADLALPDTPLGPMTRVVEVRDTRLRFPDGAVAFDVDRLAFGTSVARQVVGIWDRDLGGLGLDARAVVERLALSDVPWLRAEAPEDAVASGTVRIEPLPGDRSAIVLTGLAITSETSAATGSIRIVYGPAGQLALEFIDLHLDPLAVSLIEAFTGPLPYVGELRGTIRGTADDVAFDLRGRLATAPGAPRFTVDLTGQAAFTDMGIELRQVAAELHELPFAALDPIAPGIPLRGVVAGVIRLEGAPGAVPIQLDIRLEVGGGVVTVAGTLDLRGADPSYDLTGRIIGVELRQVLEPAAPPVRVNAAFALAGRGLVLEDATARLRMDGTFAGWYAEPGDTLALDLQVDRGLLVAERALVTLGPVDLTAAGQWRFAHGEGGAISYTLAVSAMEPLAPFLPRPEGAPMVARGALAAQGTLAGTLDAPVLAGTVRATDFFFAEWAATRFDATYDVRLGPGLPQAVATVTAADLETPFGDFRTARLDLDFTRPLFDVRLVAERAADRGRIEIEADGRIDDVFRQIAVRTLELDLEDQRWRLPAPARIEWTVGDVVRVDDLLLEQVEGPGLIRLTGILAPVDLTDLQVQVVALPVGEILTMVLPQLDLRGDLWLEGTIRGPADSPLVNLEATLVDGVIRGVAVERFEGVLTYQQGTLAFLGEGFFAEDARFEAEATLPMELVLGFPPAAELIPDLPLQARLRTESFDLAVIEPGIPDVRELEGLLTADIQVGGTALDPVLSGVAVLRDGALTHRLLNQRYRAIEGEATLQGDLVTLERLVAEAGGPAVVTGTVRLVDLTNPVLDLTAQLDRFRAQGVPGRRDAAISGTLHIGGTPLDPVLAGNLVADDGTLDLERLQPTPALGEELFGFGEQFDPLGPPDLDLLEPTPTRLRITRLDLVAGPDLWIQAFEFRAQVQGDLVIRKPGPDVMITGLLTGERGTFNLQIGPLTRRFDILGVTVQFFGTPGPDPGVDVTAARVIPGPNRTDFELRVRVAGTLSAPTLAFATADDTAIPEEEAINFLIFGRDVATLADFPGAGLGTPVQTALDAFAFYGVVDRISEAVAQQFGMGIDYFQVQVRTGTADLFSEIVFLLGHEIVDDVFVMVALPTTDFEARWAITAEWRIDRQWMLEGGYEPPDLVIGVPGRRLPVAFDREQQLFISIRRRWTY